MGYGEVGVGWGGVLGQDGVRMGRDGAGRGGVGRGVVWRVGVWLCVEGGGE